MSSVFVPCTLNPAVLKGYRYKQDMYTGYIEEYDALRHSWQSESRQIKCGM